MKKTKNNIFDGFTGKYGDTGMYKRVVNGVEIIQRCPVRKKTKNQQKMHPWNKRFSEAARLAGLMLASPEIKAIYAKVARGTCSPAAMFVKDYLKQAVIAQVVTTGYFGRVDYCMTIRVENVVPVKSVKVTIENTEGETVESGQAVMQHSGTEWHYATTRPNPSWRGSSMLIESTDIPGHKVEWSSIL